MKKYIFILIILSFSIFIYSNESLPSDFDRDIPQKIDFKTFNEIILNKLEDPMDKIVFLTSFILNENRTTYTFIEDSASDAKKKIYEKLIALGFIEKREIKVENKEVAPELKLIKKRDKKFYFGGKQLRYKYEFLQVLSEVPMAKALYLQSRGYSGAAMGSLVASTITTIFTISFSSLWFLIFPLMTILGSCFFVFTVIGIILAGIFYYKSYVRKHQALIYYNKKMKALFKDKIGFDMDYHRNDDNVCELSFSMGIKLGKNE